MGDWMTLFEEVANCRRCGLCKARKLAVPGEGSPRARLMLIGEGPGAEEDRLGRPFVGASGQLLDGILEAIGLQRREVYIANVVKCRPPQNRTPTPDEAACCLPYLERQTALVRPAIIALLGATAARYVMGADVRIRRDHGTFVEKEGVLMMPTYHPSALLREPSQKTDALGDFRKIQAKLRELAL